MTQKQPAPTARMKLTFHDSDVTNYFFLYIYFTCSCFLFTNIYTQMNCNIIIRHSDNSLCSYYLCFSCKIKFIIILLIVLTLNEIQCTCNKKLKKKRMNKVCIVKCVLRFHCIKTLICIF